MNTNQIKGSLKDAAGTVQRKVGEAIDSPSQEVKGLTKQVEGKAQKKLGDAQEHVKVAADAVRDTKRRHTPL